VPSGVVLQISVLSTLILIVVLSSYLLVCPSLVVMYLFCVYESDRRCCDIIHVAAHLLENGSVNTFPNIRYEYEYKYARNNKGIVERVVFYTVRAVSKETRQ
jgi:hypothetical protein